MKCIYCEKSDEYTDEHVFPAGLGGDDRAYLLKNLVCKHCNTSVFSKMEARFMRSTFVGFARIHHQSAGRKKGKKTEPPKFTPNSATIISDNGIPMNVAITAGGDIQVLMQLVFDSNGSVSVTGNDTGAVPNFIGSIKGIIDREAMLLSTIKSSNGHKYELTKLSWQNNCYIITNKSTIEKPQKHCIWVKYEESAGQPTLSQRLEGQFELKITSKEDPVSLISKAKIALQNYVTDSTYEAEPIANPLVHINMKVNLNELNAVIAKMGVNLIAHLCGEKYIRHHAFKNIKKDILNGGANLKVTSINEYLLFNKVPSDLHAMSLSSIKRRAGRYAIGFALKLYGGATFLVVITEKAERPPMLDNIILTVDYNNNKIKQYTLGQFSKNFPPEMPNEAKEEYNAEWIKKFAPKIKFPL